MKVPKGLVIGPYSKFFQPKIGLQPTFFSGVIGNCP